MAFVSLPRPSLGPIEVNPNLVDAVEEVPGSPGLSFVSFIGDASTRETVVGTPAAIAALLNAGSVFQPLEAGDYGPALSTAPVPPLLNVFLSGNWQYQRVGNVVHVTGRFSFDTSAPGVAFCEFFPPPVASAPTPGDTTGGGAAVVFQQPPAAGGQSDLACNWKGIGPTGGLRFELYDPTGLTVGVNTDVQFSISYRVA